MPTCAMLITIASHVPFYLNSNHETRYFDESVTPSILGRYMNCVNYTDSVLGDFIDSVLSDSCLSRSTIVITGDHTIFSSSQLMDFADFSSVNELSITSGVNYCPLLIYSPNIEENIRVTEECYQMDIFPTILSVIGCESYPWHGFGVNLTDSIAVKNRLITENRAFALSDSIIKSDFFRGVL